MNIENEFCQLVHFGQRGAKLNYQGLKIIEYYDHISIVTVVGGFDHRLQSSMINSKTRSPITETDEGVWISKYPKYDHKLSKYIIILRIVSVNDEYLRTSHTFCALVSNLIILVWSDSMDLHFLKCLKDTVKNDFGDQSSKIAALLAIPKHNPNDSSTFQECLSKQNLAFRNFEHYYSYVTERNNIHKSEIDSILLDGGAIAEKLFHLFPELYNDTLMNNYGNKELIYGPVIESFVENLIEDYNETHLFDPFKAEEEIAVQQDFEDYLLAIEKYNTRVKGRLSHEPTTNLKEAIRDIRQETENQPFFNKSPYYAEKMTVYMDRKEEQLNKLNNQLLETKNLNLLEKLSEQSLEKIKRKRPDVTQKEIDGQLQHLIDSYNAKATDTPNKSKLLTEFLEIFTPTLYQESHIQQKIQHANSKLELKNHKMEQQIKKLQKKYNKKEGKCCTIM